MSELLGNLIVWAVLVLAAGLAVRSLWRSHKQGGHCGGSCASCGGCCKKAKARK